MRFNVCSHTAQPDHQLVEVIGDDDRLLATIYPHEQGLHVVSKYIIGHHTTHGILPVPGVLVVLSREMQP
jgi:hypothetical protein